MKIYSFTTFIAYIAILFLMVFVMACDDPINMQGAMMDVLVAAEPVKPVSGS